ncbi:hydroxyacylglutathione hydrolase-like protein isoform X2 [Dromiciops gliroides]|uniref:hydroxyacylglutathione hydrolase-like protein isoform X2 n=1 Tax=Dromiciops gliroides TaxID=33562 RepID=UPI001CC474E9|nr:hydroxyacylglutathione hydrolase-like protein isoform X2 [Dromiciops gliroides]
MRVKVISVLEDNYMYLVIEENTREAIVVDATVPKRLLEIVKKEEVKLTTILTTHHHWDHSRGNEELVQLCPGLRVYGADERIGALTHKLTHNQELKFGAICVRCLLTPGHTLGHMCYFMWEDNCPDAPAVFSGDALFIGGCGRLLEGTAEQMYRSLNETLGTLPKETKVFCGHEYTVRNLKFALKVEPDNETVKTKLAWARRRICPEIHWEKGSSGGHESSTHGKRQLQKTCRTTGPSSSPCTRVGPLGLFSAKEIKSGKPALSSWNRLT